MVFSHPCLLSLKLKRKLVIAILTIPSLKNINILNDVTKKEVRLTYTVIGGEVYDGVNYVLYDDSNSIIYDKEVNTKGYILFKKNDLKNTEYTIKIRAYVKDVNNIKTYSNFSNNVIVKCYDSPTISFTGISDVINKQYATFEGGYASNNGIGLKSYYYTLYDKNGKLIKQYDSIFTRNMTGLSQFMNGFKTGESYIIELTCTDEYDQKYSIRKTISCEVEIPKIRQIINLKNNTCNASVEISSFIVFLRFIGVGDWNYIDGEYIDLRRDGYIYMDKGFKINLDFTIQIWGSDIIANEPLIVLKDNSTQDYLKIWYDDKEHLIKCEKILGNYTMWYRQVTPVDLGKNPFTIMIKQVNGRIELHSELI